MTVLSFRLQSGDAHKLRELAEERKQSVSELLGDLVQAWLDLRETRVPELGLAVWGCATCAPPNQIHYAKDEPELAACVAKGHFVLPLA